MNTFDVGDKVICINSDLHDIYGKLGDNMMQFYAGLFIVAWVIYWCAKFEFPTLFALFWPITLPFAISLIIYESYRNATLLERYKKGDLSNLADEDVIRAKELFDKEVELDQRNKESEKRRLDNQEMDKFKNKLKADLIRSEKTN